MGGFIFVGTRHWALGYHSMGFRNFLNIFQFPKILSFFLVCALRSSQWRTCRGDIFSVKKITYNIKSLYIQYIYNASFYKILGKIVSSL